MKRTTAALAAACALFVGAPATAAELEGVKMADTVTVGGQPLMLNGLGLRTRFGVAKVYVAGLYLTTKTTDGMSALSQTGAKRVAFQLKRTVDAQTFAKSLNDGVRERASPEQLAALKERLDRFDDVILALKEVKEGDVVHLDYVPASGTQIVHNGKPAGQPIVGEEFYRAILDLFVGARPVQDSLKAGMLGKA